MGAPLAGARSPGGRRAGQARPVTVTGPGQVRVVAGEAPLFVEAQVLSESFTTGCVDGVEGEPWAKPGKGSGPAGDPTRVATPVEGSMV
jgi:hypothetical protein